MTELSQNKPRALHVDKKSVVVVFFFFPFSSVTILVLTQTIWSLGVAILTI